jgi:hypothetical protein
MCKRAGHILILHPETPARPSSQSSRDEASMEAAHQEEETTAILEGCRMLAKTESE